MGIDYITVYIMCFEIYYIQMLLISYLGLHI